MALFSTAAVIGGALIAGAATVGGTALASHSASKSADKAREAARENMSVQERIAYDQLQAQKEASQMTDEERAYQNMLYEYYTGKLDEPFPEELSTENLLHEPMKALEKHYMQKGWSPKPGQTGLIIEPGQEVARKAAVENALLRLGQQNIVGGQASALMPTSQRLAEQSLGTQAAGSYYGAQSTAASQYSNLEQQLALQRMQDAGASQEALMSMLGAYASPLLQQRISGSGTQGGVGGTHTGWQSGGRGGQTWSPY